MVVAERHQRCRSSGCLFVFCARLPSNHMATAAAAIAGVRHARMVQQIVRERRTSEQQQNGRPAHHSQTIHNLANLWASPAELESQRRAQELYDLLLSFPTRDFDEASEERGVRECAICLNSFANADKVKRLPCHGQHQFHSRCLRQWWQQRTTTCPSCRFECGPIRPPIASAAGEATRGVE